MSLFSSGKSNHPITTDKVWKSDAACLKGIATEAFLTLKKSELPLIVTLFEDAHKAVVDFLDSLKVPYQVIGTYGDLEPLIQKNTIAVLRPFAHDSFGNNIYKEMKINILIFGKYPAIAVENKILESLSTHLPQARISFCLSLEEPFFKFLGADNIKSMMDTLGMKEDECIEHTMVSKAIKRAFEKIDKDLVVEIKARSEQAWFTKNLKQES